MLEEKIEGLVVNSRAAEEICKEAAVYLLVICQGKNVLWEEMLQSNSDFGFVPEVWRGNSPVWIMQESCLDHDSHVRP